MLPDVNNTKRIAKNTILLYIRSFITMCITIYTSRIVLQVLGVNDYGIYNVVGGFVGMLSIISSTLTASTQRFITFELGKKQNGNPNAVFSSAIIAHFIITLFLIIIAESLGVYFLNNKINIPADRLIAANWVFQFSLATFLVNMMIIPFISSIVAHEHMSVYAYITIFEAILKLMVVLLLRLATIDLLVIYSALMFFVVVIIGIVYFIYCNRSFIECRFKWVKEREYFTKLLGFSGWNFIGSSANVLNNYGVNIVVNLFFGVAINAARGIANQVDNAVNQFLANFTTAINPQITKSYAAGEYEEMMKLVIYGAKGSFYLLLIMVIPLMIETEYVLDLWLVDVPQFASLFTRLSLVYLLCQSFSQTLYTAMLATGNIRNYQIFVGGTLMLSCPLAYFFFKISCPPEYGYYAIIIVAILCLVIRLIMLRKMINLPVRDFICNVILKGLLVAVIAVLPPLIIHFLLDSSLLRFVVVLIISITSSILNIYLIGLSKDERNKVTKIIASKLKHRR